MPHSAAEVRKKTKEARTVIKHFFGMPPKNISYFPEGLTNFVYEFNVSDGDFVIRISNKQSSLNNFIKEQWAVTQAKKAGVPVSEILEVGNDVIPKPYMIERKLKGINGAYHENRLKIVNEMGAYTALIHTISTNNFGHVFDWSSNKLSKKISWKDFLQNELSVYDRLENMEKNNILKQRQISKIRSHIKEMEDWKKNPVLNHGDVRLKNVMINESGKIIAFIDWEDCTSNIAPYWDLSIAMHDLSIDEKKEFLIGYGINEKEFGKIAYTLKVLNVLHYAPYIQRIVDRNNQKLLDHYRLRFSGSLDMFSL